MLVASCDDLPKRLEFGRPVPDARLTIELSGKIPEAEVYERVAEMATATGFPSRRGEPLRRDDPLLPTEGSRSWDWHPSDTSNYSDDDRYLGTGWDDQSGFPLSLQIIYYGGNRPGFERVDWERFFELAEVHIVRYFPGAEIRITRHPAEMTDFRDLLEISESTGRPVPDYVMQRFVAWRDGGN